MKMDKAVFCVSLVLTITIPLFATDLVREGSPVSMIVLDKNAVRAAKFAADELQYHLKLMTGATIPIVTDAAKVSGTRIYVGESDATRKMGLKSFDFKNQESIVHVKGDTIALLGRDTPDPGKGYRYDEVKSFPDIYSEQGTVYAVYDFLNSLGFRWYLPTEVGTVYDETKNLSVNECNIRRAPFTVSRHTYSGDRIPVDFAGSPLRDVSTKKISERDCRLWNLRRKEGGFDMSGSHSFYGWFKMLSKTHPEYWAKGYPLSWDQQLCFTNPGVLKTTVQAANDYFDNKPDAWRYFWQNKPPLLKTKYLPCSPMDNNSYCKCDQCQALIKLAKGRTSGPGNFYRDTFSDYWFMFADAVAREIAKTHPEAVLCCSAYARMSYPPETFKLAPNIKVTFCVFPRAFTAADSSGLELMKLWKETQGEREFGVYPYFFGNALSCLYGGCEVFPNFCADRIWKTFSRYFNEYNVRSFFIEPTYRGKGSIGILFDQLESYIFYRLADNPKLDGDQLIEEFFRRYYGKAANEMKEFYRLVEKIHCETTPGKGTVAEQQWRDLGSDRNMADLEAIIARARIKAAADKPIYQKRVDIFDKGLWGAMRAGKKRYLDNKIRMGTSMQQTQAFRVTNPVPGDPLKVDWKNAGSLVSWYGGQQGEKCKIRISGKVCHDGQYLYLAFETGCDATKLVDAAFPYFGGFEMYFALQRDTPYYFYSVGHSGTFTEGIYFPKMQNSSPWVPHAKVVSDRSSTKVWKLYIAIPLKEIGVKTGQMLYFNAFRNTRENPGKPCQLEACWIPTFSGNHAPSRFGEIWIE